MYTSGAELCLGYSERTFTTIRTFSSTVADTEPPLDGYFVTVSPQLGAVEFFLVPGMTFAGTVAATQVRFQFWGRVSDGTARIIKLDTIVIPAATLALTQATNPLLTRRYNAQLDQVYVTVTFLDGTAPTITGSIVARPIGQSITDSSIWHNDLVSGQLIVQPTGYDSLTDSQKTVRLNDLYPPLNEINVISETSRTSGTTYYFPADTGIDMGGYDSLCMQLSVTGAGASVATVTAEASLNGTTWEDVTLSIMDDKTHAYLTSAVASTAGGNLSLLWSAYNVNWQFIRIKFVVSGANTGAVSCSFRRAKL